MASSKERWFSLLSILLKLGRKKKKEYKHQISTARLSDVHKSIQQSWSFLLLPWRKGWVVTPTWSLPAPGGRSLVLRCAGAQSIHLWHRHECAGIVFWDEGGFSLSIPYCIAPTVCVGAATLTRVTVEFKTCLHIQGMFHYWSEEAVVWAQRADNMNTDAFSWPKK